MSALIFTVGLNGYASAYSDCISSHRSYARRLGATYVAVRRPLVVRERALTAWLKVSLLRETLAGGYQHVAFIDSDARVTSTAPDFRELHRGSRDVLAVRGRSGRLNSGVIFARASMESRVFFADLVNSAATPISDEDRADLKYENGNFIYRARVTGVVEEVPLEWNNTYMPELADHIRHYTGPLRHEYRRSGVASRIFEVRQRASRPSGPAPEARDECFSARLEVLTRTVLRKYPHLASS